MDLTAIDPVWWIVVGVVIVLVVLGLIVWRWQKASSRRDRLRKRFGPEYDRTLESGNRRTAETDLERRLTRRDQLHLADLEEADAEELDERVRDLLPQFVSRPEEAAREMNRLAERVAVARGYVANDEGVLDLVSVDHPEAVAALRQALDDLEGGDRSGHTEACRQVFLGARDLAYQLVEDSRGIDPRRGAVVDGEARTEDGTEDLPSLVGDEDPDREEAAMTEPPDPRAGPDVDVDRAPETLRDTPAGARYEPADRRRRVRPD